MSKNIVSLPNPRVVPEKIGTNKKFYPYFKDCIGALDGSHIIAKVPENISPLFRNRKGFISQNILAACNFDLEFTYVLAGWEGSAHDVKVFQDALKKGFNIPPGKYYLGDAGYGLTSMILTPYRGVRYHLREQELAQQRQVNCNICLFD